MVLFLLRLPGPEPPVSVSCFLQKRGTAEKASSSPQRPLDLPFCCQASKSSLQRGPGSCAQGWPSGELHASVGRQGTVAQGHCSREGQSGSLFVTPHPTARPMMVLPNTHEGHSQLPGAKMSSHLLFGTWQSCVLHARVPGAGAGLTPRGWTSAGQWLISLFAQREAQQELHPQLFCSPMPRPG